MISLLFTGVSITSIRTKNCNCTKWTAINDCTIRLPSEDDKWLEFDNYSNRERVLFIYVNWNASYVRHNPTRKTRCCTCINGMKRLA